MVIGVRRCIEFVYKSFVWKDLFYCVSCLFVNGVKK